MPGLACSKFAAVMLCATALASAQQPGNTADRGTTVRTAQEALRADGSRPGDEKLTCEQIGEEMAGLFGQMDPELSRLFSAAERANEEVNRTQDTLAVRQATEGPAMAALATAQGVLVGTNPVAAAALGRVIEAQNQIALARAASEGQGANSALQAAAGASAGLIDRHTDKIPRMNRLVQLFEAQGCRPPSDRDLDDDPD